MSPQDKSVAEGKAIADAKKTFAILETTLFDKTFFVTEKITLADISLYCSVYTLLKVGIVEISQYPALNRWLMTCAYDPALKTCLNAVNLLPMASSTESFQGGKWGRYRTRVKELLGLGLTAVGTEVCQIIRIVSIVDSKL